MSGYIMKWNKLQISLTLTFYEETTERKLWSELDSRKKTKDFAPFPYSFQSSKCPPSMLNLLFWLRFLHPLGFTLYLINQGCQTYGPWAKNWPNRYILNVEKAQTVHFRDFFCHCYLSFNQFSIIYLWADLRNLQEMLEFFSYVFVNKNLILLLF